MNERYQAFPDGPEEAGCSGGWLIIDTGVDGDEWQEILYPMDAEKAFDKVAQLNGK